MLEALDQLALAQALRRSLYVYPLVNALHIFALGFLISSAILMDVRVLGLGKRLALADVVALLRPIAVAALALAAFSGALLFLAQPLNYAVNPVFLTKMTLLALALANAALFVGLGRHEKPESGATRLMASVSIALWVGVLLAGRLIGYFGMA